MEFWNSLLTEKSWDVLKQLKTKDFRFIVIGGWAAYLWTRQHKSKDIDIIIPEIKDLKVLGNHYNLNKNDNLKKYEIKIDEIDIDIYVPYYSNFPIPMKVIVKNTTKIESFEVVGPEILLILKQGAELDRKESIKGQKDRIDIMTLLCYLKIDFKFYNSLIEEHKLTDYRRRLKEIIMGFKEVKHLEINLNEYSKIKKKLLEQI
ncbi:MAG: hypothetical protein AABW41_04380 [Nanoarchaeota archaeon]